MLGRELFENDLVTPAGILLLELLDTILLKDTDSSGGQNWVITARLVENYRTSRAVPVVHAGPAAWVFAVRVLPKNTRNLQEKW